MDCLYSYSPAKSAIGNSNCYCHKYSLCTARPHTNTHPHLLPFFLLLFATRTGRPRPGDRHAPTLLASPSRAKPGRQRQDISTSLTRPRWPVEGPARLHRLKHSQLSVCLSAHLALPISTHTTPPTSPLQTPAALFTTQLPLVVVSLLNLIHQLSPSTPNPTTQTTPSPWKVSCLPIRTLPLASLCARPPRPRRRRRRRRHQSISPSPSNQ